MSAMNTDITKDRLLKEFDIVVDQTEQLIKSVAGAGSNQADALKASVEETFAIAGERLAKVRADVLDQATAAANATDAYVHGNPWRAVGIVAAAAAVAGLLAGLLLARR